MNAAKRLTSLASKLQNTSDYFSNPWLPACGHRGGSGKSEETSSSKNPDTDPNINKTPSYWSRIRAISFKMGAIS